MATHRSTRREFMKDGLIVTEAAALSLWMGGAAPTAAAAPATQPLITRKRDEGSPYRIGILGCGNRSKAHIAALNDVPEIDVAALCDVVPHKMDQRAQLIKKKGDPPRKYAEMEKMLAEADLDAVAVVLPNYLHMAATVAALGAGKHVFCEKPMALTVPDCNEMIAAAERARKAVQIGTQRRHGARFRRAVDVIRGEKLGAILSSAVNSYRGDWREPAADEYPNGTPYWRLIQEQCGGVVFEMGAHAIDVNNWIFDSEPVTVVSLQGVNNPALRKRDSTDHAGVLVRYANGALMNYGGNLYTRGPAAADYFFGVKGTAAFGERTLEINYGRGTGIPGQELSPPETIDLSGGGGGGDGTGEQWKHFAKVLAGEAEPYPDGRSGRQSVQVCQGAIVSAKERTVVNVKDLG